MTRCVSCNREIHATEVRTRDMFSTDLGRCQRCVEQEAREQRERAEPIMDRFPDNPKLGD